MIGVWRRRRRHGRPAVLLLLLEGVLILRGTPRREWTLQWSPSCLMGRTSSTNSLCRRRRHLRLVFIGVSSWSCSVDMEWDGIAIRQAAFALPPICHSHCSFDLELFLF